jgi:small GTP-binding protein
MAALQKIADIEAEMARTQKNKATSGHLGLLKAKLAKLKREVMDAASGSSGGGGGGEGFEVSKHGDARVGLIGFPSVGKSTLLTKLTDTDSEVAAYEFTTLTAVPGTIHYKGARIQLVDLPGIIEGAKDGKGRGKQVIGVCRTCSLLLMVLAADKPITHKRKIEYELDGFGIRLNQKPAAIRYRRKDKGGISISKGVRLTKMDDDTIKAICRCGDGVFSTACNLHGATKDEA